MSLTIFYTDDDEDDLSIFSDAVHELRTNLELHTFDHPDQFLNAINNPPPTPNLVFLDLNMPGKSGLEVLQTLRNSDLHKETPVIIFSTAADPVTISNCKNNGANYFITKPLSMQALIKSIDHALKINWKQFVPTVSNFVYKPV